MRKNQIIEKRKNFIMELFSDPAYRPMRLREIISLLGLSKSERKSLYQVLQELLMEGRITMDPKGKFSKIPEKLPRGREGQEKGRTTRGRDQNPPQAKAHSSREPVRSRNGMEGPWAEGVFVGHPRGFGFVELEGEEEDIYIPEEETGSAMHQDRVRIVIHERRKDGRRREGTVVEVLERGMKEIVGTYHGNRDYGFIVCDNPKFSRDVFIHRKDSGGARHGDKVVAVISDYGGKGRNPEGKIIENLGNLRTPGTDILAIVKSFGIPTEFPEKVLRQALRVPDHVLDADREGRLDLRDIPTVTIDGEDAKDLDDAVSLAFKDGHYYLGVHIADVSNYVQGGSALDREALKRGTSVYLADRVIPMLPRRLSNGICSLNQGQDRLALSCLMEIDGKGTVVDHKIMETVICVDERMTYSDVRKILEEQPPELMKRYRFFVPTFFLMKELSSILRKGRHSRGSIDFDFPESRIILSPAGKVIDIQPYETNVATRIIEDFMLLANETVAMEYCQGDFPFVYRTHENPDPEKVESLLTLVHNQGIPVQKAREEISPGELQNLLESIAGLPNEPLIARLALRTMKQARYTTQCSGHFGLAAKYYCHFTSPIRRYPDLQIHRIIKDNLRGRLLREGKTEHYREILDEVARQSSVCERRADEAERESDRLKKAEYMSYHLGEEFEGMISGVTGWGFFVELPNTVEGLVHVNSLRDDYYIFDENTCELTGERTGRTYHLGDKVRVRVENADPLMKTVDFVVTDQLTGIQR